jgi:hypothetical protein
MKCSSFLATYSASRNPVCWYWIQADRRLFRGLYGITNYDASRFGDQQAQFPDQWTDPLQMVDFLEHEAADIDNVWWVEMDLEEQGNYENQVWLCSGGGEVVTFKRMKRPDLYYGITPAQVRQFAPTWADDWCSLEVGILGSSNYLVFQTFGSEEEMDYLARLFAHPALVTSLSDLVKKDYYEYFPDGTRIKFAFPALFDYEIYQ